jgi:hypothetical protein
MTANVERLTRALRIALSEYCPGTDQEAESVAWVARALGGAGVVVLTRAGPWKVDLEADGEDFRHLLVLDLGDGKIVHGRFASEAEALTAAGALNATVELT